MSLSDLTIRVQTLSGQIKQADADVAEGMLRVERARKALEAEERVYDRAIACARELRAERDTIADKARDVILAAGEPVLVEPSEAPLEAPLEVLTPVRNVVFANGTDHATQEK